MTIKRLKSLGSAGDTIVEVMIVLAVLGLAFGISYATASRGLNQSQNAEEHSQALKLLETQVELVRAAASQTAPNGVFGAHSHGFCMNGNTIYDLTSTPPSTAQQDTNNHYLGYPSRCIFGDNNLYHTYVSYSSAAAGSGNDYFVFTTRWDGLGGLGSQQEQLTYRVHQVTSVALPSVVTIDLKANGHSGSTNVNAGSTFSLHWSVDPTSANCTASGDWSGAKDSSGPNTTSVINTSSSDAGKTLTYTLSCTAAGGGSASQTVTVQVNSLQFVAHGSDYSSCSAAAPAACGTTGTSVFAYQTPMQIFYPISNLPTSSAGQYKLTLNYGNYNLNGDVAPPRYSYSINVYVNGQLVKLWSLPDTSNSATTTFTLSNHNIAPNTVQITWINDDYYCSVGTCYDANFRLDLLKLETL